MWYWTFVREMKKMGFKKKVAINFTTRETHKYFCMFSEERHIFFCLSDSEIKQMGYEKALEKARELASDVPEEEVM